MTRPLAPVVLGFLLLGASLAAALVACSGPLDPNPPDPHETPVYPDPDIIVAPIVDSDAGPLDAGRDAP